MADRVIQCPKCGVTGAAALRCGCQTVDIRPELIPATVYTRLALPLPDIVRAYFEKPGVQERYERWLEEVYPVMFPQLAAERTQRLKKAKNAKARKAGELREWEAQKEECKKLVDPGGVTALTD